MEISKPDDLGDNANLGFDPHGSRRQLLARVQQRDLRRTGGEAPESGGRSAPAAMGFAG